MKCCVEIVKIARDWIDYVWLCVCAVEAVLYDKCSSGGKGSLVICGLVQYGFHVHQKFMKIY